MIDQYRVKTDKRRGITSGPNNPDDDQYIVRLVGQVVRVAERGSVFERVLAKSFGGELDEATLRLMEEESD